MLPNGAESFRTRHSVTNNYEYELEFHRMLSKISAARERREAFDAVRAMNHWPDDSAHSS